MKKINIPWKKSTIDLEINGVSVIAEINWWSKDYFIDIIEPKKVKIPGEHMMYSIPCRFVLNSSDSSKPFPQVEILPRCIKKIKKYFEDYESR